jgi:hypothetical protein
MINKIKGLFRIKMGFHKFFYRKKNKEISIKSEERRKVSRIFNYDYYKKRIEEFSKIFNFEKDLETPVTIGEVYSLVINDIKYEIRLYNIGFVEIVTIQDGIILNRSNSDFLDVFKMIDIFEELENSINNSINQNYRKEIEDKILISDLEKVLGSMSVRYYILNNLKDKYGDYLEFRISLDGKDCIYVNVFRDGNCLNHFTLPATITLNELDLKVTEILNSVGVSLHYKNYFLIDKIKKQIK